MMASGTPEIERDWLKFDILTAGTVLWKCATNKERTISYRKNGEKWTKITSTTSGVSISVAKDDVLEFKGNNADYGGTRKTSGQGSYFAGTATFNASGNISTMLNNSETLPATLALAHLFHSAKVVSAQDLILPYMTLTSSCYYAMFYGCTNLTTAPELPATTLADYCYQYMFRGCTNLVSVSNKLPATTLKNYCYSGMFYGCSKLVEAPYLPATGLVSNCYGSMFYNCSKLQYIHTNFSTTPSDTYTKTWVTGVAAKGVFDKNGKTWNVTGVNGVPTGWLEYSGLAFIITTAGTITWKLSNASGTAKTVSYSTDGSTWTSITSATTAVSISFSAGDVVLWKGEETQYATSSSYYSSFGGTAYFDAVGNIMSLLNNASSITNQYAFCSLFRASRICSASHLRLPTSTYSYCYNSMFRDCISLTTAPELPATNLASSCYYSMFMGCTSLTTAPELPSRIMVKNCYQFMFMYCSSLTTAPELPAKTLAQSCYDYMFRGCTSLTTAPELPAKTLAQSCYQYMFQDCTSLTTAPELPATNLASSCYSNMFNGCTSLTTAPELPATTLASYCYEVMFYGCTSLNKVTCLATSYNRYMVNYWLYNVASTGTFIKNVSMTSWPSGASGIPEGWDVVDYEEE
jgi:hypothetical protein